MLLSTRRLSDPSGAPRKCSWVSGHAEMHEYQAAIRESQTRYGPISCGATV
jgi:hypothetical protein